jgi:type II secretory pathway pseudopilin PulG
MPRQPRWRWGLTAAINQMPPPFRRTCRRALTLLDCMVAIAIVGVLAALTVLAVQRVRAAAARIECSQRLHDVALAVQNYESFHHKLPEGVGYPWPPIDMTRQMGLSWQTSVLPYMDQTPLWDLAWQAQCEDSGAGETPLHRFVEEQLIPGFLCPTERYQVGWNPANGQRWGITSYLGVAAPINGRSTAFSV